LVASLRHTARRAYPASFRLLHMRWSGTWW
jgi:hypothetical protein